ncbi:MAG: hypothetical protein DWP95_12350, partial [Proteobacteria bacterium]
MAVLLAGCDQDNNSKITATDGVIISEKFQPATHQKEHKISAFVEALEQAQLAFQVSGRLSKQWIDIGEQVNQGDELLSLYNPGLAPQIDRIKAQITANQAALQQSQKELQR